MVRYFYSGTFIDNMNKIFLVIEKNKELFSVVGPRQLRIILKIKLKVKNKIFQVYN